MKKIKIWSGVSLTLLIALVLWRCGGASLSGSFGCPSHGYAQPENLALSYNSSTSVTLSWNNVCQDSVTIAQTLGSTPPSSCADATLHVEGTQATINGLTGGNQYSFLVCPQGDTSVGTPVSTAFKFYAYVTLSSGDIDIYSVGTEGAFTFLSQATFSLSDLTEITANGDNSFIIAREDNTTLHAYSIGSAGTLSALSDITVASSDRLAFNPPQNTLVVGTQGSANIVGYTLSAAGTIGSPRNGTLSGTMNMMFSHPRFEHLFAQTSASSYEVRTIDAYTLVSSGTGIGSVDAAAASPDSNFFHLYSSTGTVTTYVLTNNGNISSLIGSTAATASAVLFHAHPTGQILFVGDNTTTLHRWSVSSSGVLSEITPTITLQNAGQGLTIVKRPPD